MINQFKTNSYLDRFRKASELLFGGPGSGPNQGGSDTGGGKDDDASSIQKIAPEKRTEKQVTTLLKGMSKKELQGVSGRANRWLQSNKSKVGTPEHKRFVTESNVSSRLLQNFK